MAHRVPKKVYIYKMRQEEGGGDSETDECLDSPISTASPYTPLSASDEKTEKIGSGLPIDKCSTEDKVRQDLNEGHDDLNTQTEDGTSAPAGDAGDSFNMPSPPGGLFRRRVSQDCSKSTDVSLFAHRQLQDERSEHSPFQRSIIEPGPLVTEVRTESGSFSCSTQTLISLSPWEDVEFVTKTCKRTINLNRPNISGRYPSAEEKHDTDSMFVAHSPKVLLESTGQQRNIISNVHPAKQPNQAIPSPEDLNVYRTPRPSNRLFLNEHSPNVNSSLHHVTVGQKSNGTSVPESPGSSSGYSTTGSADSPRDLTINQQETLARKSLESYNQSALQRRSTDQAVLPLSQPLSIHARSPKSYDNPVTIVDNPSAVHQKQYMHSVPRDNPSHSNDLGVKVEPSQDSCCDHYYNSNITPNLNSEESSDRVLPARVGSSRDDDGGEGQGRTDGRSRRRSGVATKDTHSCQVCGEVAAGFHCGAYICEACKKFFLRCLKNEQTRFSCSNDGKCTINKDNRVRCQYCRYQRCLELGMYKPGGEEDKALDVDFSKIPCKVCGAPSSGYHFGAITCEGCKGFFRRTLREAKSLPGTCSRGGNCNLSCMTRNVCKACRWHKCLDIGMTPQGSRIGRQPNSVKRITLLQHKHLQAAKYPDLPPPIKEEPTDNDSFESYQDDMMGAPPKLDLAEAHLEEIQMYDMEGVPETSSRKRHTGGNEQDTICGQDICPTSKITRTGSFSNDSKMGEMYSTRNMEEMIDKFRTRSQADRHLPDLIHMGPSGKLDMNMSNDREPPALDKYEPKNSDKRLSHRAEVVPLKLNEHLDGIPGMPLGPAPGPSFSFPMGGPSGMPGVMPPDMFPPPSFMNMGMPPAMRPPMPGMMPPMGMGENGMGSPPDNNMFDQMVTACVKAAEMTPQAKDLTKFNSFDTMNNSNIVEHLKVSFAGMKNASARPPEFIQLCQGMVEGKVPAFMVINYSFSQHSAKMLMFAKAVPGFKKIILEDKISLMKQAMYPIMLLIYSQYYNLETNEYSFFNCTQEEQNALFRQYPEFELVIEHFRYTGKVIADLGFDENCRALFAACLLFFWEKVELKSAAEVRKAYVHYRNLLMDRHSRLRPDLNPEEFLKHLESLMMKLAVFNKEHTDAAMEVMQKRPHLDFQKLWREMYA